MSAQFCACAWGIPSITVNNWNSSTTPPPPWRRVWIRDYSIMDEKKSPPESVVTAPPQPQQQQPVAVKAVTPHSFLACSICFAIFCGLLSPATLSCTIPAAILSGFVSLDTVEHANNNISHMIHRYLQLG